MQLATEHRSGVVPVRGWNTTTLCLGQTAKTGGRKTHTEVRGMGHILNLSYMFEFNCYALYSTCMSPFKLPGGVIHQRLLFDLTPVFCTQLINCEQWSL